MTNVSIKTEEVSKTFFALGTINNIRIPGSRNEKAADLAVRRVAEIDDRMSAFKPESDIGRLSGNAGRHSQKLHDDTFRLLQKAVRFSLICGGAFDITIRPLVELWGINKKGSFIPSDAEIREALELVGYQSIQLDEESMNAYLEKPGQCVDLGGIAKGYAADEVRRILIENGVTSALINLGGNVSAVGNRPDGKPWKVGIQNPLAPTGQYLGVLSVTNRTVVTSGCNERFFIKDGVRYHHILDPRTGKPAQSRLLSVTAVCENSADADALTTAMFVLGPEKSLPLLYKADAEAIFIFNNLAVAVTKGLSNDFSLCRQGRAVIL